MLMLFNAGRTLDFHILWGGQWCQYLTCRPRKEVWWQRRPPCHALSGGLSVSDWFWLRPAFYRARETSGVSRAASVRLGGRADKQWECSYQRLTSPTAPAPCISILLIHKCLFSVTQGSFWHLAPLSIRPEFNELMACFHLDTFQLNTSSSPFSQAPGWNSGSNLGCLSG